MTPPGIRTLRPAFLYGLLVLVLIGLFGCGGGGGTKVTTPPTQTTAKILETQQLTASAAGGTLAPAQTAATAPRLTLSQGAVTADTPVTLEVYDKPPVTLDNTNIQPVSPITSVTIPADALGTNPSLTVEVPLPASQLQARQDGLAPVYAICVERSGEWDAEPASVVNGKLTATLAITPPQRARNLQALVFRYGGYLLSRLPVLNQFPSVKLFKYRTSDHSWQAAAGNMAGTRIALCVHGFLPFNANYGRDNLYDLAAYLNTNDTSNGKTRQAYDAIYAVEYPVGYGIDKYGEKVAQYLNNAGGDVDIFAHSLGGLVARSAIEMHNAQHVRRLVTFSTPHHGIPAALLVKLIVKFSEKETKTALASQGIVIPSWLTLWPKEGDDLIPGAGGSGFLESLANSQHVPTPYYGICGADANQPEKYFTDKYLSDGVVSTLLGSEHDGMVGTVSSGYTGVSSKCGSWTTMKIRVNHDATKRILSNATPITPFSQVTSWLGNQTNQPAVPTLSLTADNTTLTPGQSTTLRWTSTNATTVVTSNFGATAVTGTKTVSPSATTTYTITVSGNGQQATASATVTVSGGGTPGANMVWVPGGSFTMGTPYNAWWGEPYTQQVALSGYWIDKYEVTVAQYRAFCTATGRALPSFPSGYSWAGKTGWADPALQQHPIVYVTWYDAKAYADWAGVALPTEAQWEYAARGPSGRNYPWGGTATAADPYNGWDQTKCANYYNSYSQGKSTWPVGSFPAGVSWCGAHDLAGNVWEWCADWSGPYSTGPVTNPTGPATGTVRVLRGGSWDYGDGYGCRGAVRGNGYPGGWDGGIGFRCVSSSPGP